MAKRRHPRKPDTMCDFCGSVIERGGPIVYGVVLCHEGCAPENVVLHVACRDLLAASLGVTPDEGEQVGGGLMQRWS